MSGSPPSRSAGVGGGPDRRGGGRGPRACRQIRLGEGRDDLEPGDRAAPRTSSAGRSRSSRSARAGASTACSATRRGSASTSRSRPMRLRRRRMVEVDEDDDDRHRPRRPRPLRDPGPRARRRGGRPGRSRVPPRGRLGRVHRDLDARRRASRPPGRVPDRADGPLAGRPDRGSDSPRDAARRRSDRLTQPGQRRDAAIRPGQVRDRDPLPVEPDQAASLNWPSSLFTLWRVQPTIEASSAWVRVARRWMAPSVIGRTGFGRQADEHGRQPPGDVEEMQLLDVVRQPAKLPGQRGQQGVTDGRLRGDQLAELLARQHDRLGGDQRGGRGRTRRAVEKGQLTEDVALARAS